MKKIILISASILLVGGMILGGTYNSMMKAEEKVESQFANVESKLQRRYDLIPSLVNSVKGSMEQEKEVFGAIASSREKLAGATTMDEKIKANSEMESSLSKLLMVVENYPELKSQDNVAQLMDELAGTENRISTERDRFNTSVKEYNSTVKKFPKNIFANIFGFDAKPYFEASKDAQVPPTVDFK